MSYDFTTDWTSPFRETAERLFLPLKGKELSYLEIGSFEGRSVCWMLDNVLTHPSCRIVCVDWLFQSRFHSNIEQHNRKNIEIYSGNSKIVLPNLKGQFDIIYIDGDHSAEGCLFDTVACWRLVQGGGIILWDDYLSKDKGNRVKKAVDAFLTCIPQRKYRILSQGQQFAIRKRLAS